MFIETLQKEGEQIGLQLNKHKAELLILGRNKIAVVKFKDGTPIKRVEETTYLGVQINEQADPNKQLRARITNTMATWKRLGVFFKQKTAR